MPKYSKADAKWEKEMRTVSCYLEIIKVKTGVQDLLFRINRSAKRGDSLYVEDNKTGGEQVCFECVMGKVEKCVENPAMYVVTDLPREALDDEELNAGYFFYHPVIEAMRARKFDWLIVPFDADLEAMIMDAFVEAQRVHRLNYKIRHPQFVWTCGEIVPPKMKGE